MIFTVSVGGLLLNLSGGCLNRFTFRKMGSYFFWYSFVGGARRHSTLLLLLGFFFFLFSSLAHSRFSLFSCYDLKRKATIIQPRLKGHMEAW